MTRKLKTLGLALVAVLAMSSLAASAVSAALPDTDAYVSESAPVKVTGTQENGLGKLTLAGQAIECTTATTSATVNSTTVTEILSEVPTISGCTYAGMAATVTMNGCKGRATGTTDTAGDAKGHVVCEAGKTIKLTLNAIACEVFIASQEAEEGYTVTTVGVGATRELTVHGTAKVKVTSKGDLAEGVTCASLTNGTATLEGTAIVKGEDPTTGAQIGITDETLATE